MNKSIVRVQLDDEAKARLDELCKRRGMTQISVMSRTIKWLVQQDETIQNAVLASMSEEGLRDLARRFSSGCAEARL